MFTTTDSMLVVPVWTQMCGNDCIFTMRLNIWWILWSEESYFCYENEYFSVWPDRHTGRNTNTDMWVMNLSSFGRPWSWPLTMTALLLSGWWCMPIRGIATFTFSSVCLWAECWCSALVQHIGGVTRFFSFVDCLFSNVITVSGLLDPTCSFYSFVSACVLLEWMAYNLCCVNRCASLIVYHTRRLLDFMLHPINGFCLVRCSACAIHC